MLDFDRLRAFVTVARTSSVTRAAAELHVSQSPLSRKLAALEAELGVELFVRERKRLRLSHAGRAFRPEAEALLRAAAAVERRARAWATGDAGHVTVGYVAGAIHARGLVEALVALRRRAPGATVELVPLRSREQEQALAAGAIDVGYSHAPGKGAALVAIEPFVLAVPRGERGRSAVRLLAQRPLVTLPESTAPEARDALLAACARIGARPTVGAEAADPAVVLSLVGAGLGVALVQEGLVAQANGAVRGVRLPAAFGLDVRIYRRVRPGAPALARALGT